MQALSQTTRELCDEVHALSKARKWPWQRGAQVQLVEKLNRIAESGESLAIPRIISLVLDSRDQLASAVTQTVVALKHNVSIRHISTFDQIFRDLSPYLHNEYTAWCEMKPRDLSRISNLVNGPNLLQLAMCHPNGYVREEAIKQAAVCSDGAEVPFLILRVNDWVEPVRKAAAQAVRLRLRTEAASDFVKAIPLIDALPTWGRHRDAELILEIEELLASKIGLSVLESGFDSEDHFQRRSCLRRLLKTNPSTLLIKRALDDKDPVIHILVARLFKQLEWHVLEPFVPRLLNNPAGVIRLLTLRQLIERNRTVEWKDFLCDRHSGVRSLAQSKVKSPAHDFYRQKILDAPPRVLAIAMLGLGETGNNDDLKVIRHALSHDAPRVRRAALHSLTNLGADDQQALCLEALADEKPSVSHTARDLLIKQDEYLGPTTVWDTFLRIKHAHGKKDALIVIADLDYWQKLPFLLNATTVKIESVRERAQFELHRWCHRQIRIFTTPSPDVLKDIDTALANAIIEKKTKQSIGFAIDQFKPKNL